MPRRGVAAEMSLVRFLSRQSVKSSLCGRSLLRCAPESYLQRTSGARRAASTKSRLVFGHGTASLSPITSALLKATAVSAAFGSITLCSQGLAQRNIALEAVDGHDHDSLPAIIDPLAVVEENNAKGTRANAVAQAAATDEEAAAIEAQRELEIRKRARGPRTWALVLKFCWQDIFSYVSAIAFSACTALLSISEATIMKSFFDSFTSRRETSSADTKFLMLQLFAVVVGESICATLASSCLASATNSLKQKLREYLLDKLLQQDEAYFDAHAVGAITDQVNEDVNEIGTALRVAFTGTWQSCMHASWH